MIDWNMGQPAGSFDSGRKTPILGVTLPPPALLDVTAGRPSVGQPTSSSGRDALFQSTVATALNGLADIQAETRRLAQAFRGNSGNDLRTAHRDFEVLVETLRSLTMLTAELGHAAGQDAGNDADFCSAPSVCGMLSIVAAAVESLIESHRAGDWRALADGLELELLPALKAWRSVFGAISARRVA
jgi:hypothetical protein